MNAVATTHDLVLGPETVTKTFQVRYGDEAEREWSGLQLLERHAPGLAPSPVHRSSHDGSPSVAMTRLPGVPLGAHPLTADEVGGLAAALDRLHAALPPAELSLLPVRRAGGAEMVTELRDRLAESARSLDGSLAPETAAALHASGHWLGSAEAATLAGPPADPVFTQADGNLANFLWDGTCCRVLDFEDSGVSDRAYEVADLMEHVSASRGGLVDPDDLTTALGLSAAQCERVLTARRMFASFWLLMLLPGHPGHARNPVGSLEHQVQRVQRLLRSR